MTDEPNGAGKWWTRTKILVEIGAVFVAGYWAFTRFNKDEAPSLEERITIQGELKWQERSENDCFAQYNVKVENIGRTSIEVGNIRLSWWLLDEPPAEKEISFFDPKAIVEGKTPMDQAMPKYLVGSYAPSVSDTASLAFRVRKAPGRIMVLKLDVMTDRSSPWDYRWDYVCGEGPVRGGKPRISRPTKSPSPNP
jgi:hypothetical protein